MHISLLVPPAIDWNMPLIALPLLKAYLPNTWKVKVIDINAKLFNSQFGCSKLNVLKKDFLEAINKKNLQRAVDTYLDIEESILQKQIGATILENRSLYIIDEWLDSNKVFEYLQNEHQLSIVLSNLLENCIDNKQDVFGISITIENQIIPTFIICAILREKYPNSKIILGGNIVSRLSENLLKSRLSRYFDLLMVGEGESTLQKAIEYVTSVEQYSGKIYSVCNDNTVNLFEKLKTPDFSDICWNDYLTPVKVLPITVQRKCKWNKCDFCAIHSCWTHGVRDRNVYSVVDEIEKLISLYEVKYFRIVDEMVSADYLLELSSLLLKRNISIYFEAYVRFEEKFCDISVINTIFNAGCRQLFWGLENINDNALKFMNKGINKSLVSRCLEVSKTVGITNYCFILMGIPKISIDSEIETIDYVIKNKNIHIGVVGSFVIDRLSPIHVNQSMHKKYGVTLFDLGDLTTEVGYLQEGEDRRWLNKHRTEEYIKDIYIKRPDYAICSLLSEEARLVLTATFGNTFANEYISYVSETKRKALTNKAIDRLIEERVVRKAAEV